MRNAICDALEAAYDQAVLGNGLRAEGEDDELLMLSLREFDELVRLT